jgi:N6-L-threonylcarbamoyladenine synthase
VSILTSKIAKASAQTGIMQVGIAGGVSANSALRDAMKEEAEKRKWELYIPKVSYTTDNAAMIGIAGYFRYLRGEFTDQSVAPLARFS